MPGSFGCFWLLLVVDAVLLALLLSGIIEDCGVTAPLLQSQGSKQLLHQEALV